MSHEERIRRLEAQLGGLLDDPRIGGAQLGAFPVIDSYMGYRRIGAGRYYLPGTVAAVQDNTKNMAVSANKVYALPFLVTEPVHVGVLGCYTQSGATGNNRMGVYRDGTDLVPAQLIEGSASKAVGSGFTSHTFSPVIDLYRGLHWIVSCWSGTPTMYRIPYEQGVAWEVLGRVAGISTAFAIGWIANHAFAALPDMFPSAGLSGTRDIPIMWVKIV
jgi:hypothetical protein